jgi:hypothetical protein
MSWNIFQCLLLIILVVFYPIHEVSQYSNTDISDISHSFASLTPGVQFLFVKCVLKYLSTLPFKIFKICSMPFMKYLSVAIQIFLIASPYCFSHAGYVLKYLSAPLYYVFCLLGCKGSRVSGARKRHEAGSNLRFLDELISSIFICLTMFSVWSLNMLSNPTFEVTFQQGIHPVCCLFHRGFLLDVLFNSENGSDILLRNIGGLSQDYTALWQYRS